MIANESGKSVPVNGTLTPTECLTKGCIGQLSPSDVVSLIFSGFKLDDVTAMISLSKRYLTTQITERIFEKKEVVKTKTAQQRLSSPPERASKCSSFSIY